MIKAFCCWSGGKDSALSLYRAQQDQQIEVTHLLNMLAEDGEHSRSHGIRAELLKTQASAIDIPIVQRKATARGAISGNTYEQEFKKVVLELKDTGVDAGIFGDIDLQVHRDWVERVCKEIEITPILLLWKGNREELITEFIDVGFKTIVVTTNANYLGKEWLGRQIDKEFVAELKALGNIDLCGEDGEFHTFVYDGPIFKHPVKFTVGEKVLKDNRWFLEIKKD
ncbi:diphthine--ammonia ligase [bacterium]|nr:diphthine--ammonia ligase [bacterium]MBU1153757.1 diphthine--ammonia ligase [bacterium]MBU1782700.1 diphthine--ammonia ligase [bacterium]